MNDIQKHFTVRIELLSDKITKQYNVLDVTVNAVQTRNGLLRRDIWCLYKNYVSWLNHTNFNHDNMFESDAVDALLNVLYTFMVERHNYRIRLSQAS